MINFYKNNGVGTIQFESGETISLSDDVNVRVDNTVNQIIISEFNRDKFWISTAKTMQVNGVTITGTNQQKADLIAPIFQQTAQAAAGVTSYTDLTNKPTIPATLDQITDTSTRTAISPAERTSWNAKAVQADINAAIASLVNTSPVALDTLKELADAMGDDPNFAATVTNSLAGKVNTVDVLNALTQTVTGKVLDARQGKILNDLISANTSAIALKADKGNAPQVALTDAATIVWDFSLGNRAKVTLGGNRTLSVVNSVDGDIGILDVYQDGVGNRTLGLIGNVELGKAIGTAANGKDKITFENVNSTFDWIINNFSVPQSTLLFTGATLVNTNNVWTTTGTSAGYGNTGIVTGKSLAASTAGRVMFQNVSGNIDAFIGFSTTNAAVPYTSMVGGISITSGGLSKTDNGTYAFLAAATTNLYYCLNRSATGVLTIQSSPDKVTWTTLYTLTATSTAALYVVCDFYGTGGGAATGKMYYPQGEGLQ